VAADTVDLAALVAFLDMHVHAGSLRDLHVKIGPHDKCTTARVVMHRSRDGFIRVGAEGDEQRVFAIFERAWPKLRADMTGGVAPAQESIEKPTINVNVTVRQDDVFRAVAKTAFNVLAADVGVAMALRPEFDPLRAYILGTDIRHPTDLAEGEIAIDGRFVRQVPHGEQPLVPTDVHAVTISYQRPKLLAFVTLYKGHSFVVELATIDLADNFISSHEFSTVRQGNTVLDLVALYDRLSKRK
jgi:hypothetical protein